MASIAAACNIRIFRIETGNKTQFITVYGYPEKSNEFLGEGKVFTTKLENYHLTVVQTLMKGGMDEFISAANLIAKDIYQSNNERK